MSSSAQLPSPENDYAAPGDPYLNRAFWDAALTSVGARIRALEAVKANWEELIAQGTGQALAVIQANVEPQLVALTAIIDQLKADVASAEDAIAVINAGGINMSAVVGLSVALTLKANITYVDAAIDALKGGAAEAYDTLAEIAVKLIETGTSIAGKVPTTRKLIGGSGVKLNGGAEANLEGDVTIAVAGVPTGAVIGFDLDAPPAGWIVGDGSAINRLVYSDLDAVEYCGDALNAIAAAWYRCTDPASPATTRSVTGNYLVTRDLRDYFPRFAGVGRAVGSVQLDAFQGHRHGGIAGWFLMNSTTNPTGVMPGSGGNMALNPYTGDPATDGTHGTPRIASETRPINVAVLGCIKY